METTITLRGQLYGEPWMGCQHAWLDFEVKRTVGKDRPFAPLYCGIREMLLHVPDGDFQRSAINNATLTVSCYVTPADGRVIHTEYTRYDFRPEHHLDCFTTEQTVPFSRDDNWVD